MVHPAPFLTPHLVSPKDIATKRGEDMSGAQFYNLANFQADWPDRRQHICPRTKNTHTRDLVSDKTHTSVAFAG